MFLPSLPGYTLSVFLSRVVLIRVIVPAEWHGHDAWPVVQQVSCRATEQILAGEQPCIVHGRGSSSDLMLGL